MPQRRWIEHYGVLANEVFTLPANPARRAVILSNNSESYPMTYRVGGSASADVGVGLETNKAIALDGDLLPEGIVTLFCAGDGNSPPTGGAFTVYEVVG